MEKTLKTELFKNIKDMMNEIELCFDYIDKNVVKSSNEYVKKVENEDEIYNEFVFYTFNHLMLFEKEFSFVLFSKEKVKTKDCDFLNRIKLFGKPDFTILNFNIFQDENKNTKKNLIKYLYNIYMSVSLLNRYESIPSSELSSELQEFISRINTNLKEIEEKKNTELKFNKVPLHKGRNIQGGGVNVLQNLMGNGQLFDIANDIAKDIGKQDLDPMAILSSIMSGNLSSNSKIAELISTIQSKVEHKVQNGELDPESLQKEAQNIMNSVDLSSLGDLKNNTNKK